MDITKELRKIALDLLDYQQLYESDIGHPPHYGEEDEEEEDEEEIDKKSLTRNPYHNQIQRDLVPDK